MGFSKWQLAVLMLARVVEPIGYTIFFPYVNQMVESLLPSVPKASIGKYSGLIESVFALSSALFMYQWGKLSDRVGRRPVILLGLGGVAFTHVLFGLSQNYAWAMIARFLSGALCGNSSVMRAVLGEFTTKENEGWVYPLWTVCWDISCVIGPAIGALLQNPVDQYPSLPWLAEGSKGGWFFRRYPYFLPSALIGTMSFLAAILVFFCLEETNPACIKGKQIAKVSLEDTTPNERTRLMPEQPIDTIEALPPAHSFIELISIKAVQRVLTSIFLLTLTAMSFDAGFVLFAYSSIKLGGIALTPTAIASCLSVKGGLSIAFNLLVFPIALRKIRMTTLYRSFAACWIMVFTIPPIMNLLLSHILASDHGGSQIEFWIKDGSMTGLWLFMIPLLILYVFGDLCFPLNMLALNAASPGPSSLGGLNGISLITGALARSMGPAIFGFIYGISAEKRYPLVWIIFGVVAIISAGQSWKVDGRKEVSSEPEPETEGVC